MNKYTEAIQGDDVVILCDGIPMGVGEILAALNAATPLPADAALADALKEVEHTLWQNGFTRSAETVRSAAARLRALSQPTAPVVSGQNPVAYGAVFNGRWMANVCRGSLSAAIAQGGINTEIIPLVPQSATQPATVAQVPEGFVLVPVEPTNRMMIAGAGSWVGWQESSMHDYLPTPDEVRDVYCAMLAASQSTAPSANGGE